MQREEAQARRERRVAEDVLQVDRQVREHREHAGRDAERRDRHADERALAEERHVEHRPRLAQLDDDEREQQEGATDERQDDRRARPAESVPPEDPEDDQEQRCRERQEAQHVGAARSLVARLRDPGEGDGESKDADRDVHEEDPPPPEQVGEEAADERSAGDRGADGRAPRREGAEAVRPAKLVPDEGESRREQRGAAQALQRARDVERGDAPREAAEERRQGEEHDPGHEHQTASVPVGERAGREDQRGEAERVGVDDPLQPGQAGVELAAVCQAARRPRP